MAHFLFTLFVFVDVLFTVRSLLPIVCRRAHVLFTLFVFVRFIFTSNCL